MHVMSRNVKKELLFLMGSLLLVASCEKKEQVENDSPKPVATKMKRAARDSDQSHDELRIDLEAAMKIEAENARIEAIASIAWKALERSTDIFNDAFRELPVGNEEKNSLLRAYIVKLLEKKGPSAAVLWANSLDNQIEITQAHEQIALNIAESDPTEIAKFLPESSFEDGHGSSEAVEAVQRWTLSAPSEAVVWASKLSPGKGRQAGVGAVVEQWFETDPKAAILWVNSLRDSNLRADVLPVVSELFEKQPQSTRDAIIENADEQIKAEIGKSKLREKAENEDRLDIEPSEFNQ